MTNLADLLPAGGGQNNTDFVADGTISSGAPVVLNSDGKISPISATANPASFGSAQEFTSNAATWITSCFHAASGNMVVVYLDSGTTMYAVAGTVSGETITWGTPAQVYAAPVTIKEIVYDPQEEVVVLFYRDIYNSNYGTYRTASVSGTGATASISWNTATSFYSGNMQAVNAVAMGGGAGVIAYSNAGSYTVGHRWELATGGATLTMQGYTDFSSYATSVQVKMAHDTATGKIMLLIYASVYTTAYGVIGTVTSGSPYFALGSNNTLYSGSMSQPTCTYDVAANKTVFTYFIATGIEAKVGTADVSAGTISFGTAETTSFTNIVYPNAAYDINASATAISFQNANNSSYCDQIYGTISGTDVTFTAATTILSKALTSTQSSSTAYESVAKKIVTSIDNSTDSDGESVVSNPASTNLTSTNLLGIASGAISDTATGTINTWGSRCENSSFLGSALSAGSLVAFETSGSPSALSGVAFDANAGKMVIAYTYGLNGYAIVGTVSGTSASYGTAVIFQASAAVYSVNAAYDANAQKVVIIYTDGSNSDYPTAIVGTVSGTSISFGTKVAFLSSGAAGDPMSIAYDANAQKVVIGFRDTSNSNYGTGIVGTVSGTSISFGTKTAFNSSATLEFTTVYDSDAQKVAIGYRDAGNLSYGTAVVGTVSGTSISFGSPQVFLSAQTDNMGGCFDSTNNKVVFCYRDTGNSNYGTAIVGTISGTSISFGSSAVYNNGGSTSYNNASYDAGAGKVIISYAQGNAATIAGTVSGTSISFDTAVVLDAGGGMGEVGQAYDSTNAKTLIAFQSAGNSYHGYSATVTYGDLPLTVASDYYVQTDGSLSTDTGGQLIGKAITTTQINIKDYTG